MTKKVTFEFFDARVYHPDKGGEYLCIMRHGTMITVEWYENTQAWNVMNNECWANEMFPAMWAEVPEGTYDGIYDRSK